MVIVSLDSFDAPRAGCTTHVASLLILHLESKGFKLLDYPNLVRLNPVVPWKTRGNAAVSFEVSGNELEVYESAKEFLIEYSSELSNRGALFVTSEKPPLEFYFKSVKEVTHPEVALEYARRAGQFYGHKGSLIGAIAAAAAEKKLLPNFELIAYRSSFKLKRRCDFAPFYDELALSLYPYVHESGSDVVCPRGSDPVLYGLRGRNPSLLISLAKLIRSDDVSFYAIFRTNQHSITSLEKSEMYVYDFKSLDAYLRTDQISERNRDFVLEIDGGVIVYEETGLKKLFNMLKSGNSRLDCEISVLYKPGLKSLASIKIRKAVSVRYKAPRCPKCGGSMVSKGKNTLLRRCKKCGYEAYEPRKMSISLYIENQFITPTEGRKLHLIGDHRSSAQERAFKGVCEYLERGCALAFNIP